MSTRISSETHGSFFAKTHGTHWCTYVKNGDMLYSLRRVGCAWNFIAQTEF